MTTKPNHPDNPLPAAAAWYVEEMDWAIFALVPSRPSARKREEIKL